MESGDFFPRAGGGGGGEVQLLDNGKEKYTRLAFLTPFCSANLIKNLKPKFKNIIFLG